MAAPSFIDYKQLYHIRQRALSGNFAGHDFLYTAACAALVDRLSDIKRQFPQALALDDDTGLLTQALEQHPAVGQVQRLSPWPGEADAEAQPPLPLATCEDNSFDLIMSCHSLPLYEDVPGLLLHIKRVLKPDGLWLSVFPGQDSFLELRHVLNLAEQACYGGLSPRMLPTISLHSAAALLQRAGFALPVVDLETHQMTHSSLPPLLHDLRGMGWTNCLKDRSRRPVGKRFFSTANQLYQEHYATEDGQLRSTLDFIYMTGWKPAATQQKPLRPGASEQRLSDFLK